jgi:plastocyanin
MLDPKVLARAAAVLAVVALCWLPACGDSSDDDAAATGGTEASDGTEAPDDTAGEAEDISDLAPGDAVEIQMQELSFSPAFLQAEPGSTVTVALQNSSGREHTFTIDSMDVDEELAPGDGATVDVAVPESGELPFYCRFHQRAGMKGAFLTNGGGSSGGSTEPTETTEAAEVGPYGY